MSARTRAVTIALLTALALAWRAPCDARDANPVRPRAAEGRVVWCAGGACAGDSLWAPEGATSGTQPPPGDSLARWATLAADTAGSPAALREYARGLLARGEAARAESLLGSPRLLARPWRWQALQLRAEAELALGDSAGADSLLAAGLRGGYAPEDADGASPCAVLQVRVVLGRGQSERAEAMARRALEARPGDPGAPAVLELLERACAARGDSLGAGTERLAAEVEILHGRRAAAILRLQRAEARLPRSARFPVALRLAEQLRAARQSQGALAAAGEAGRLAPDSSARARADLERARALRDAGTTGAALALYAVVARMPAARHGGFAQDAWWEYAREAEDRSRWAEALEGFRQVVACGGSRADAARLQGGLVLMALARPDSADAWLRGVPGEAAWYWDAIALRGREREASDSLLRRVALQSGYGFYRAMARETLGVRGWPGTVAAAAPPGVAAEFRQLAAWGLHDDAARLLRLPPFTLARDVPAQLGGARLAYEDGGTPLGTRLADGAWSDARAAGDSLAWSVAPWGYPPAYEDEVVAAESLGVERALMWALVRQESRFSPAARSRSDALGLTQLKLGAARDVARALGEPPPRDSTLLDPAHAIRYGARYLAQQLRRFDGRVAVALAAYNAGAAAVRPDWRALIARGGEALYAEFASNADTQDYVKHVLGYRQAYRELAPTVAR